MDIPDMIREIGLKIDKRDLNSLLRVSFHINSSLKDDEFFWKQRCNKDYPSASIENIIKEREFWRDFYTGKFNTDLSWSLFYKTQRNAVWTAFEGEDTTIRQIPDIIGKKVFAGPNNILIIDHDDNYHGFGINTEHMPKFKSISIGVNKILLIDTEDSLWCYDISWKRTKYKNIKMVACSDKDSLFIDNDDYVYRIIGDLVIKTNSKARIIISSYNNFLILDFENNVILSDATVTLKLGDITVKSISFSSEYFVILDNNNYVYEIGTRNYEDIYYSIFTLQRIYNITAQSIHVVDNGLFYKDDENNLRAYGYFNRSFDKCELYLTNIKDVATSGGRLVAICDNS